MHPFTLTLADAQANTIAAIALTVTVLHLLFRLGWWLIQRPKEAERRRQLDQFKMETNRQVAGLNYKFDEANRIAEKQLELAIEALEHERQQTQVNLKIDPRLDFHVGENGNQNNPLSGTVVVSIKNVGPVDAVLKSVFIETSTGSELRCGFIRADTEDAANSRLPAVLKPGHTCMGWFLDSSPTTEGFKWAPPDYAANADWTNAARVVVIASHHRFESKDNWALNKITALLQEAATQAAERWKNEG